MDTYSQAHVVFSVLTVVEKQVVKTLFLFRLYMYQELWKQKKTEVTTTKFLVPFPLEN